ncbi:MAG: sulfurtransferase [Desulfobacterales bacterium]|nr:sulfurtransferase [Desulfobacterales bacterium]
MTSEPKSMTRETAKAFLDSHSVEEYILLDVRQDYEYEEFHLPGAKLIPLPELADHLDEMSREKPTIVYCASGGRSAAAALLLSGQRFKEVYNLLGGVMAWRNEYAVGPSELGMDYFSGKETPLEILALAFKMEDNLGSFYAENASSASSLDLKKTFMKLAGFEEGHKAKVFAMAKAFEPSLDGKEDFASGTYADALEGGMGAEPFLEENREYFQTPKGTLEAAMMFEAQALDLYMRCTESASFEKAVTVLHQLAQEEKSHLKILAKLMESLKPSH